jgi:hypothetical protein
METENRALQCRALHAHDWPSKEWPKPGETQVCGRGCGTSRSGGKKEPKVVYQSPAANPPAPADSLAPALDRMAAASERITISRPDAGSKYSRVIEIASPDAAHVRSLEVTADEMAALYCRLAFELTEL